MKGLVVLLLCIYAVSGDKCPDGSSCSTSETCCASSSGQYGCCPMPNAVCCSDGAHCCPEDTTCDLVHQQCVGQNQLVSFLKKKDPEPSTKTQASPLMVANKVDVVYCPGGVYYCPDGNTCCLLSTGQYGCCPYPSAQCCNDHVHCCPYGTHCDPTSQYCLQGKKRFPVMSKRPAFLVN